MNYAIKTPNLTRPVGYGRSLQVLTANDAEELKPFTSRWISTAAAVDSAEEVQTRRSRNTAARSTGSAPL